MTKTLRPWLFPILGTLLLAPAVAQSPAPSERPACKPSETGCAQDKERQLDPEPSRDAQEEPGIQDNSFLVEEAYNQESGVVQHIQSFQRSWTSGDWAYSFTQEWPVNVAPRNQLSFTVPIVRSGGPSAPNAAVGDIALNYRYQLIGSGDTKLAFSPRFTVLLPSGDSSRGYGAGGTGIQVNLPLSAVLSKTFVTHWNAGATFVPSAKGDSGSKAATTGFNLGQSTVWVVKPRFNVLLETVYYSAERVVAPKLTERATTILLNPGVRWAHNFKSGLQIVPGISIPVGVGPSVGEVGLLFYLSFEHPFRRMGK